MVSHRHTGTHVSVRSDRARDGELTELDSVYKHHPLPSMPRFMTSSVQRQMTGDSMLAYTERMREFTKARNEAAFSDESPRSMLQVRAQHIPKSKETKKGPAEFRRRRPLSLDELIGRPDNQGLHDNGQSKRRFSVPSSVPSMSMSSPREKDAADKQVRISFVSAADLFDLVDFSLRSKRSRNESIKLARAEDTLRLLSNAGLFKTPLKSIPKPDEDTQKAQSPQLMVTGSSSPRETVDSDADGEWARAERQRNTNGARHSVMTSKDENFLSFIGDPRTLGHPPHKLRTRPKRAKRMKLHRSHLSAIPEDDQHHENSAHAQDMSDTREPVVPTSLSLAAIKSTRSRASPRNSEDADEPARIITHKENKPPPNTPKKTEGDMKKSSESPRIPVAGNGGRQTSNGQHAKGAKVKAQKKFRKLIFLRDYPDQTYNRYS